MRVRLTLAARHDLVEIAKWVAKDSPERALRLIDDLESSCRTLKDFPESFPIVVNTKELEVRRKVHENYLISYHILPKIIEVLHIVHGSRDWQEFFGYPTRFTNTVPAE
jgi:toxin ParE1/3/4